MKNGAEPALETDNGKCPEWLWCNRRSWYSLV